MDYSRKRQFLVASALASGAFLAMANGASAWAACTTAGSVTTCDDVAPNPVTSTVGTGRGDDGVTVNVDSGATLSTTSTNAISIGSNVAINVADGATVTTSGGGSGLYGTGNNTIEFYSNGTLTVAKGGQVLAAGTSGYAEAVNVHGYGNTITNYGLIQGKASAAIWFQDWASGAKNVVDNYGVIEKIGGSGNVIGTSGGSGIVFYNRTGAEVIGSLGFAGGNDELYFFAGSSVTGNINGGGGTNALTLEGATGSSDTLGGNISNFSTLTKAGEGQWTVSGSLSGFTLVTVENGTLALTGNNSGYTGSVVVEPDGVLEARAQSLPTRTAAADNVDNVTNDGLVRFVQPDDGTYIGQIVGTGAVEKTGAGVLTLAPVVAAGNLYSGGTAINGGTLAVAQDTALGAATGPLSFDGGTLRFNDSFDLAPSRQITLNAGGGTIDTNGHDTKILYPIGGVGGLTKVGAGTLTLWGPSSYAGGAAINGGTLAVVFDAMLGAATGPLSFDGGTLRAISSFDLAASRAVTLNAGGGTIDTNGNALSIASAIDGAGGLTKVGAGTLTLSGANGYTGATAVDAGALYVNGDQGAATGATTVASGATIGGTGTLGGDLAVADGATLAPGAESGEPGTLTVNGNLNLASGSTLAYNFGAANVVGGPLNDLTVVKGDLTLDGTIDVATTAGGSFDPGVYRVISYDGALTDNGLAIGTIPSSGYYVQTSIAQQVNLVNTAGLALTFWDGAAGPKNDGVIQGGDGLWQYTTGNDNWTESTGTANAPWDDASFAIFGGTGGTATVDNSLGAVSASGMQFATDGYTVTGEPLTLVGTDAIVRVGDGTADGAGYTATIASNLTGESRLVKTDLGTLVLTGTNDYAGGTAINGGTLAVAKDAALGAATGPLSFDGGTLRFDDSFDVATSRAVTLNAGGGTIDTNGNATTVAQTIDGVGSLTKVGAGTLTLSGTNSYAGGTTINGGTLAVAKDAALGAATGPLSFDGGTLRADGSFDLAASRAVTLNAGGGTIDTNGKDLSVAGPVGGVGSLTKTGAGTLTLSGPSDYRGATTVEAGTLAAGADNAFSAASAHSLAADTVMALQGYDQTVGALASAGTVRFGTVPGTTLTVAGDYAGQNGTLELNTVLGDDSSVTDRLVVQGDTSGTTQLVVSNVGGTGAPTVEGINVVDVTGASNGTFVLQGDYTFQGDQAVVGGAYAYRLYKGGTSTPDDGDWYLRSSLINPTPEPEPEPEPQPLYQPGVPVYEGYVQNLQALNELPTLQQRVGNRSWAKGMKASGLSATSGFWGRIVGTRLRPSSAVSTTGGDFDTNVWKMQMGGDVALLEKDNGSALIFGMNGYYGRSNTNVGSVFGDGSIKTDGMGVGATLTYYGADGFYADVQGQYSGFDSTLKSSLAGRLVKGNDGAGVAASIELGKRMVVGEGLSVTPQFQTIWSHVSFDGFTDVFGAKVSATDGSSIRSRLGVSLDRQKSWAAASGKARDSHVYAIANVIYEWQDGTNVNVSGTPILNRANRFWGELGLGGSYSWNRVVTLYAEVGANTAFADFGDSYSLKGTAGLRISF